MHTQSDMMITIILVVVFINYHSLSLLSCVPRINSEIIIISILYDTLDGGLACIATKTPRAGFESVTRIFEASKTVSVLNRAISLQNKC